MKKLKIIATILLVVVNIWMRFYAPIVKVALVLKHISLFLLLGIIAYSITTFFLRKIIKRYNPKGTKETIVYVGRSVTFGLLVIVFGVVQFNYIQFSETPYTELCKYYDNYNNLVYETMIYESCPELDIITLNDNIFEFEVSEQTNVYEVAGIAPEQEDLSKWDDYELITNSTIRIEYDDIQRIIKIDQQLVMLSTIGYKEGNLQTNYYGYHKIIDYDYSELFEVTYKEAEVLNKFDGIVDVYTGYYIFDELDYSTIRYYADNLDYREAQPGDNEEPISGDNPISYWHYDLYKEYLDEDSEFITEHKAYIIVIKENGYYMNSVFYPEHDGYDVTHRVDLYHTEDSIKRILTKYDSSDHDKIDKNITYENTYPYFINKETYSLSLDSIESTYIEEAVYRNHMEGNITYTYSEETDFGIWEYSPYIYGSIKTEYGYRVSHQRYRNQLYLSNLLNGQYSSDKIYFEHSRYSYGLRHQILFDVDYSLDWIANTKDALYVEPSYIVNIE